MRLVEVEIRNWRGLTKNVCGLSPRLNLVLGPNESGKSRIFQAIRYGLFESYKGAAQHKQLLQSWASPDAPYVRVVFVAGNVEYEIQKQFLKGATAQLAGGGATVRGDEAEDSLRLLTGSRQAGNRGVSAADLGIWPLLMVPQGESRKALAEDINEDGRSKLHERLSREIGVTAISGSARRVMALAEQEFHRYFTATGQEAKILREARAAVASAVTAYDTACAALQRQEQTATALADNRRELSDLKSRSQLARQLADAARLRAEAAQAAAARVGVAQGGVNTASQLVSNAAENLRVRIEADDAIERLTSDFTKIAEELEKRLPVQELLEDAAVNAANVVAELESDVANIRSQVDAAQRERRRTELLAVQVDVEMRIASLSRIEQEVAAVRDRRAALPLIDATILSNLQTLDQESRAAWAKLQGAAVRVLVHAIQPIVVDGVARQSGERVQIEITENQRVVIGSVAELEIRPGAGQLDRLRESKRLADCKLAIALQTANVIDLDHAAKAHAELTDCDRALNAMSLEAKATSSMPLDQLLEELARVKADIDRLGNVARTDREEKSLIADLEVAVDALNRAKGNREAALTARIEYGSGTTELRVKSDTIRQERDRLAHLYAKRPTAENLRTSQAEAIAERERQQVGLTIAQNEFSDLGGTEVEADARRLMIAAEGLSSRTRDVGSVGDKLQGALQGMIETGNYESVQQAGAHLERTRTELLRLERQAGAAKQLWDTLSEERRRVVERLTAPVALRVKPYLQDLFPGSSLEAGEGLEVVGLHSGNIKEPFAELSGGAQEQVSLLTRIGLAEVLAGDGTLPLILDDALINTDPERIRGVHRALFRAAERLQIIVFSCHGFLFDGLGADFVINLDRQRYGGRII